MMNGQPKADSGNVTEEIIDIEVQYENHEVHEYRVFIMVCPSS